VVYFYTIEDMDIVANCSWADGH